MIVDLVKRFTSTPREAVFSLNGSLVRVASNSQMVLNRLQSEYAAPEADSQHDSIMNWRIVVEEQADVPDGEFIYHTFAHNGLSFIRIANESFLAADRKTRCGISFVTANLVEKDDLFRRYFLPALVSMINEIEEEV